MTAEELAKLWHEKMEEAYSEGPSWDELTEQQRAINTRVATMVLDAVPDLQVEAHKIFKQREWQEIKRACESILHKELTWDQVVTTTIIHCKMAMKEFVKKANS
jgi:hypothetical protein